MSVNSNKVEKFNITQISDDELALRWWNRMTVYQKLDAAKDSKFTQFSIDVSILCKNNITWIWRNQSFNK